MNIFPDEERSDDSILSLLEICLTQNTFTFNDKLYIQTSGCAMGKTFAPAYANIFMRYWETKIETVEQFQLTLMYKRYIDDILFFWTGTETTLQDFFQKINTLHDSIKLTMEYSNTSINFLDLNIYKGSIFNTTHKLDYKTYFKDTDTHQLLNPQSYHPKHTITGVIKSQITRYLRNSSDRSTFNSSCSILFKALKQQHYSQSLLRSLRTDILKYTNCLQYTHWPGTNRCGIPNCTCCNFIICARSIGKHFESQYTVSHYMTCKSKSIIYIIHCSRCNMNYVGETGQTLKDRLYRHLYDIRTHEETSPVSLEFHIC